MQLTLDNRTKCGCSTAFSREYWRRHGWELANRGRRIRFSISALVRVRVDDQFLLVRGYRIERFQPVGGVLKYYPTALPELMACGLEPDVLYERDEVNENDLRIVVRADRLCRFLKWYESGKGREHSPWREFYRELIVAGHISHTSTPFADFQYLSRHSSSLDWNEDLCVFECFVAEMYEWMTTPAQEEELRHLMTKSSDDYRWATLQEIEAYGIIPKQQAAASISNSAVWLLES